MTNKKPMLILLAAGTASGKGTLISKIKESLLLSDKKICKISTDDYVTITITEKESNVGEIIYGFGGTG
jgi:uridine kinase